MIEAKFQARSVVVFVLDIPRPTVERFVGTLKRGDGSVVNDPPDRNCLPLFPFYFVDYQSLLGVSIGNLLTERIFYWSCDGNTYPLRHVEKE